MGGETLEINAEAVVGAIAANPILGVIILLCLGATVVNGATDAPNAIATVVGTRAMRPGPAIIMAAACNFVGMVLITYEDGVDVDNAAIKLRERFDALTLPSGCSDPVIYNFNINENQDNGVKNRLISYLNYKKISKSRFASAIEKSPAYVNSIRKSISYSLQDNIT